MPTPRKTNMQRAIERTTGVTRPNTGSNNTANIRRNVERRGTTALTATYRQTGTGSLGRARRFTRGADGRLQPAGRYSGHSPATGSTRTFAGVRRNG